MCVCAYMYVCIMYVGMMYVCTSTLLKAHFIYISSNPMHSFSSSG